MAPLLDSSSSKGTCLETDSPGVTASGSLRKVRDLVVVDLEADFFLWERAGVELDITDLSTTIDAFVFPSSSKGTCLETDNPGVTASGYLRKV